MIPCGKQEPIVNNYNRKICKPDFWRGLQFIIVYIMVNTLLLTRTYNK